jgi:hypothetical protein
MKQPIRRSVSRVLLVSLASTGPAWAHSLMDEVRLHALKKNSDYDTVRRLARNRSGRTSSDDHSGRLQDKAATTNRRT